MKNCVPRLLGVPGFDGFVAGALVEGLGGCDGRMLQLFSVHAPKRGTYQAAVNTILDEIGKLRDESDLIIGGDFNLTIGQRQSTESLTTAEADLAIQNRLRDEFGLINCWQSVHSDEPLPQTLRWSRDRSVPYHCDGIFVPSAWSETLHECTVISSPEWEDRSDHSPVVVELNS